MGLLLKNAQKVNQGSIEFVDVLIEHDIIIKIAPTISRNNHE